MKEKCMILSLLLIVILVSPLFIPICRSDDDPREYYFEDVNVLIIGRCRTIVSYGDTIWVGGLFSGAISGVDVMSGGKPLERFSVYVYNTSIIHSISSFTKLHVAVVGVRNATGLFFWSAKGFGRSFLPPILFVKCNAKQVWISIYDK